MFHLFSFADRPEAQVLKGLSLTVEPGQSLALVGYSGSGKSTVISLLMKFFTATGGSIRVGGQVKSRKKLSCHSLLLLQAHRIG